MKTLNEAQVNALLSDLDAITDGNFAICAQTSMIELYSAINDDKELFIIIENELKDGQDAIFNSSCDIKDVFQFHSAYSFECENEALKYYTDYILNNR